jgi:Rha family phage regulatory protein
MKTKQLTNIAVSMTSLQIAELTRKEHRNVLRDIEEMTAALSIGVEYSSKLSCTKSTYKASNGKKNPMYILPKRETLILVSGYSTELRAKIIDRLEHLEKENELLRNELVLKEQARSEARLEYKPMSTALKETRATLGKTTEHFHYSNEANLINIIVMGNTSKKLKEDWGLDNLDNLRDELTPQQIAAVQDLQKVNTSLIDVGLDYEIRKEKLKALFSRKWSNLLIEEHIRLEA